MLALAEGSNQEEADMEAQVGEDNAHVSEANLEALAALRHKISETEEQFAQRDRGRLIK